MDVERAGNHSIGVSYRRVDARGKIVGRTRFLPDIRVEGMAFAYPVVSPVPFGRITVVDDSRARGVEGYLGLVTAKDVPGRNQVGVIIEDQPLFADEVVRFIGDVVGLAVAESDEAARRAAALVEVSCEEYQPIFSIEESRSVEEGRSTEESHTAPRRTLHESNIACRHRVDKGDAEAALAGADVVVDVTLRTPYQEHYYLEPQGAIALPRENGGMEVLGSLQCPFYVQKAVAQALALPLSRVRVVQSPVGGAFGGKEDVPSEVSARAAVAAAKFRRPVKVVYRRRDDVQLTSKRHPCTMRYRVGVKRDGTLVAADVELQFNAGAYATLSSVVSYRGTMQALGPYRVPNVRVRSTAWYTNLPPAGAFRGFGSPQVAFGHERVMDIIAEKLGLDPVEFRLRNLVREGDESPTGHKLPASVGVEETVVRARDACGWDERRAGSREQGRTLTGIGIATSMYGNCLGAAGWTLDGAGARLQIRRDGSIVVAFGLVEMGQGALTVVAQMTAEALGVDPGRVTVAPTDTANVPDSGPSVASRNVVMTGNAIRDAADKLRPILHGAAAELLDCPPEQVEIRGDRVRDTVTGNDLGFHELAEYLFLSNRAMDMVGWWHVPKLKFDAEHGYGEAYFTYSYATHVAQVSVDRLTGLVHVEKIWAAHDIGRAINPAGIEGQVEGGTAQGIGWALTEHFQTEGGRVTTSNLSTYLLPSALDVAEVETIIVESPEPLGPWGAKGVGEPAIIPTGAAIANAVSHALGAQIRELPILPETVLDLLEGRDA